jgi:hypothetical protein
MIGSATSAEDTSSSSSSSLGPKGCCNPDKTTTCKYDPKDPGNFSCTKSGYHPLSWNCCTGGKIYMCGECINNNTSCTYGTSECSVWWQTSTTC